MAKIADIYFKEHPWQIIEEGFDPEHAQVAESVFALANEYMGVRGYFEEGYSGKSLKGSYFGGIYEQKKQESSSYVGIPDITEFMVNAVDWLYTRIEAEGQQLDLHTAVIRNFSRTLDFRSGLLKRSFLWEIEPGKTLQVTLERILSMEQVDTAAQKITLTPLDFSGDITVRAGLDTSIVHGNAKENFWDCLSVEMEENTLMMTAQTVHTKQQICSAIRLEGQDFIPAGCEREEKKAVLVYSLPAKKGDSYVLERRVCNLVCRSSEEREAFAAQCFAAGKRLDQISFSSILERNTSWWGQVWRNCDIEINGDPANQQGIRFCIFQLFQTYHGAVKGSNIGAKGLTGEAYNGNAFWDTETYCLPFFLFNDLEGGKNLLYFRYRTLEEAKKRAKELDCQGAFYPIATISGKECCNLWQHSSLQLQASTAVAYGIWFYEKMSGDQEFLAGPGLEMLIEICRMLATRGDFSGDGSRYGYFCVMGPDEFQMMVNHNCYTNYMGRFTFRYTLEVIGKLKKEDAKKLSETAEKTGLTQEEQEQWQKMADRMYISYDEEKKLYEQHEGFFTLPHVDVDQIPVEEFPLYHHWSYDRIYRNDMIKQPDVLMMMLLFNGSFSEEELRVNYEYYEPRCIHESSLSPSVHSILASQLKKRKEAYEFFRFATRMDLDNYNRNSGEGIHTTSIAAAWMNIVYGFGGLRSDGACLALNPSIPDQWNSYSFHLHYGEDVLTVQVDRDKTAVLTEKGTEVKVKLYGEEITLGKEPVCVAIPGEWRE